MEVIGVGVGRTGTRSLKVALEQIGYTPCYHMLDVILHPGVIIKWLVIGLGKNINWGKLFKKYKAGVDYPFPTYYKKYLEKFPNTKVILTIRDPEDWYESAKETIYPIQRVLINWLPFGKLVGRTTIWYKLFDGRFKDREFAIGVFKKHIEEVKVIVPKEKLLIYNIKEGWGPLCEFLNVQIPRESFPHVNRRVSMKIMMVFSSIFMMIIFISVMYVIYRLLFNNYFPF
ncbi:MAG: sulfotransferase family protein [Anaerolineae bacterium]|nr:sulfotransferase family protein [Anaerolineae bacterium]